MKVYSLIILSIVLFASIAECTHKINIHFKESDEKRMERALIYKRFGRFNTFNDFLKANKDKTKFLIKHMKALRKYWYDYQNKLTRYRKMYAGEPIDTLTNDGGYFTGAVQIGTPAQDFTLDFDTGSADLWVADSSCGSNCAETQTFNPSASSTYQSTGQSFTIQYGSGSASGTTGTDTVSVAGLTATGFVVNPVTSDSGFPGGAFGGIFGFGWQSLSAHQNNPSPTFVQTLKSQGQIQNALFSLYLGLANSNLNPTLIIGDTDSTFYTGSIKYYTLASATYWEISWSGISVDGSLNSASENAIVDSGTTLIVVSGSILDSIENALGVSGSFDCNTQLSNIVVEIGSDKYPLTPSQYLASNGSECELGIQPGALSAGFNVLGDVFLVAYYAVFDFDNSRVGFAPVPSS